MSKRVEDIEHISGTINKKISLVLIKLEAMEEGENKKKEHMSKMMDDWMEDDTQTVYMESDDNIEDNVDDMDDMDDMEDMDDM